MVWFNVTTACRTSSLEGSHLRAPPLYNVAAMNLLGRRSLSSFFKVLLDVTFYAGCLAGVLLVVATVFAARTDNSNVSVQLPVRFEIAPSAYRIQAAGGAGNARIEDAGGNVTVTGAAVRYLVIPLVFVIGVLAMILVVLRRLRRIFRRLAEGRPFVDENARTIGGPGRSDPASALDTIIATVVRFRGTAQQSDDMTMMLVTHEGAAYLMYMRERT